jgi:protease-4
MVDIVDKLPIPGVARRRIGAGAPRGLMLELDLTEPPLTAPPGDPLAAILARRRTTLRDVLDGLARGAADPKVVGMVAKLGAPMPLATAQEVRDAVLAFRRSGKPTLAWAETFGEFVPGTLPYYLATAFDSIWLGPSGDVVLAGVRVDALFLRRALDTVGVEAQIGRRHEYKNASNALIETGFTDAHRQATAGLVASVADQLADGIASRPGIDQPRARELLGAGAVSGLDAVDAGLVDRLGYRDQVLDEVRRRVGGEFELRYVSRYRRPRTEEVRRVTDKATGGGDPAVALVHAHGVVRLGRNRRSPLSVTSFGSDTVSAALRAAARHKRVRAVVLRVDSPGGSYVASDVVWREVARVRQAGTPVIVSMGDLAASGGYFVSMGADVIVAQPGTLTGSIGVLGGKLVQADLVERLRVDHDAVDSGGHAGMFSPYARYTGPEWELVDRWLDRVYDDFTAKAAQGRGLTREQVHEVARGRVWTGAQARERGLVDELGGLHHALALARDRVGLPEDAPVLDVPETSPIERLRPARSSDDLAAAGLGGGLRHPLGDALGQAAEHLGAEAWGPLRAIAAQLGLPAGGPLLLPVTPLLI